MSECDEEDLVTISHGSGGLYVTFVLARPCGRGMYTTERTTFIPSHILWKIVGGRKFTGDLARCRELIRDGQDFELNTNLKRPFKEWYAARTDCYLPEVVDVKGANICVANGRLSKQPGCAAGLKRMGKSLLKNVGFLSKTKIYYGSETTNSV